MEVHGGVIVKRCQGCSQVNDGRCRVYRNPVAKWSPGRVCLMASHVNIVEEEEAYPTLPQVSLCPRQGLGPEKLQAMPAKQEFKGRVKRGG